MGKPIEIAEDLLLQAVEAGIDVNGVAEAAIRRALEHTSGDERAARWAADNADAIEDYNRRIRERGVFSDGRRTW
jgi:post-segregation antitoxin (ccd killing protein)